MHKFLTLALLALTACAPELEAGDEGDLNATTTKSTTLSTCTKTQTCNGALPQTVIQSGSGNGITCAAHMEDCVEMPIRPLGNVFFSDLGSTFAIAPNEEEAHEYSNGNPAVTVAKFTGLPTGVTVIGVYKGDFIRPAFISRTNVVTDELLIELSNGQYLMTPAGPIGGTYSMSAASGPSIPTFPGGGGTCTIGPC